MCVFKISDVQIYFQCILVTNKNLNFDRYASLDNNCSCYTIRLLSSGLDGTSNNYTTISTFWFQHHAIFIKISKRIYR